MSSHVTVDRLQFTLTVTFHYLFPILTMGLALYIAWLKTVAYKGREQHRFRLWRKTDAEREQYELAARFWAKIFAVNFAWRGRAGVRRLGGVHRRPADVDGGRAVPEHPARRATGARSA